VELLIKDDFSDDPLTIYTLRPTYGTRHSQAGTELPVLAELMGRSNIQTTMIYVHAARKQKIEATARLQAYVGAARRAKRLRAEEKVESSKPIDDKWGLPIVEVEESSPQKSAQEAEIEDLPF